MFIIILLILFLFNNVFGLSGGQWSILASSPNSLNNNWIQEEEQKKELLLNNNKCFNITEKFTLCHGMQYKTMRLPNLLEHETMEEAIQQSSAWISLLRLHCHVHTKLFLCSLFAPICLTQIEKSIYPCQSLCNAVKEGCAIRMEKYGFPWPEMLNCSKFPLDNDLCIKPPTTNSNNNNQIILDNNENEERKKHLINNNIKGQICKSCAQVATFENLMDNFCRSSIVIKVKVKPINSTYLTIIKKMRIFKSFNNKNEDNINNNKIIKLSEHGESRCFCHFISEINNTNNLQNEKNLKEKYLTFLVMASEKRKNGEILNAKLIIPWKQEKV